MDTIGGVDYDVPVSMNYDDPDQGLSIHLESGYQHLDGNSAVGVVRWRKSNNGAGYFNGDIGRIATQQDFLKTVAAQCLQIGNVTKIKQFADIFIEYVDTDLTWGNLVWYGQQFLRLTDDDIAFYTLPGNYDAYMNNLSYVAIDVDAWIEMINDCLNPYITDVNETDLNILTMTSDGTLYTVGRE